MTVAEIAQKLRVPHATVRNYFNGRLPATEILAKIADETGVSLTWLLTNKGPQWASQPAAPPGGEIESLSEENGFSPRQEAVVSGPEKSGSEARLNRAQLQLIIEQNSQTIDLQTRSIDLQSHLIEQNNIIIQLLERIVAEKVL